MHSLCCALTSVPFSPMRVTHGALVAQGYSYMLILAAETHSTTGPKNIYCYRRTISRKYRGEEFCTYFNLLQLCACM